MVNQMAVLNGPFDVDTHKATFTNYLEVVVFPNGRICYANPSHIDVMKRAYRMGGGDPDADCPREYWCDYDGWLMRETGCVCVWTGGYMGEPNEMQAEALKMLVDAGLLRMRGDTD